MTIRAAFPKVILAAFFTMLAFPALSVAQGSNRVLGQVDFTGKTKAEKTAGVWIDGQYVGYVDELKGDKQVLLLPGMHKISVRQTGYLQLDEEIGVDPGKTTMVKVELQKNPKAEFSSVTSQIKLEVTPDRAAVLVDGAFAGVVHDFGGVGRAMLVAPGKHHVKIDLVGYQPFDTDVDLQPNQKITIKTDLVPGSVSQTDPALNKR
jgi:PEGA domain